jgi:hypothetical protein
VSDLGEMFSSMITGPQGQPVPPNDAMRELMLARQIADTPMYRRLLQHSGSDLLMPQRPASGVPFGQRLPGRMSSNIEVRPIPPLPMTIEDILRR